MKLNVLFLFKFITTLMNLKLSGGHKFKIISLHDYTHFHLEQENLSLSEDSERLFFDCSDENLNEQIVDNSIPAIHESYEDYEFKICVRDRNTKLYMHENST